LLNISENATFLVSDPTADRSTVLRINRPGYHSRLAIESELAWIRALREADVVRTATILPATNDSLVVIGRHVDGEERHVVLFEWIPGAEPAQDRLVKDFEELGVIAARLHQHARTWQRPNWFTRFRWDYDSSIGQLGHWGRWQDGMGMGRDAHTVLARLDSLLRDRLETFGTADDRFGLIHADMRLANLLVDESSVTVIDFDDCGFSWYLYDLGSSLSFIEDHRDVPQMIDSWLRGYRSQSPLSREDEAEIPTFVLLRRLTLVAWIGSHSETVLAQEMGEEFTRVSCDLAEDYLSRFDRNRKGV
jgi:Ser/Thr protein kinase RdoA (MazF antagonist)